MAEDWQNCSGVSCW